MDKKRVLFVLCSAAAFAQASPLEAIIQSKPAVNQIEGNVAAGSLDNTSINATAIASGNNAYAAAGGIISNNSKKGKLNKQRAEVKLENAQIDAHAEASNGNKAFAGAYVNK